MRRRWRAMLQIRYAVACQIQGACSVLFSHEAALWQQPLVDPIHLGLPVYLLSGAADPVHAKQANLARLIDWLQRGGLRVDADIYPDARHEILNETNRDDVIQNLMAWLLASR